METVYSLYASGEDGGETDGEVFSGLPKECILGALQTLEGEGRCEVFGDEDDEGVKFF